MSIIAHAFNLRQCKFSHQGVLVEIPLPLKESLHIISVAIFYYEINWLSSLEHGLVTVKKSLKTK